VRRDYLWGGVCFRFVDGTKYLNAAAPIKETRREGSDVMIPGARATAEPNFRSSRRDIAQRHLSRPDLSCPALISRKWRECAPTLNRSGIKSPQERRLKRYSTRDLIGNPEVRTVARSYLDRAISKYEQKRASRMIVSSAVLSSERQTRREHRLSKSARDPIRGLVRSRSFAVRKRNKENHIAMRSVFL